MLPTKVKGTIKKHSMVNPGDRIIVAVSGGPDSVCLLGLLHSLSDGLCASLHVAHLDHMFRGKESADEALFVADLAKKLNIPATVKRIDVPAYCSERGLSPQVGAREVRYGFLQQVAKETGSSRIATGHTADDQAETFLMRLLRGAGVSGLSAIPPMRENIIRPLIEVTRQEVLEHLAVNDLEFKTDPSNSKPLYTRNRVRLEVLPVLMRFNPRIVETLAAEAALLREENEAMDSHLSACAAGVLSRDDGSVIIKREEFNSLPLAFKRRLFRRSVDLAGEASSGLSAPRIEEALQFMATAQTGRTMDLPLNLAIAREYDCFVMSAKSSSPGFSADLLVPGVTAISPPSLEVETFVRPDRRSAPEDANYLWQAEFDYDKIGPLLTLRSRRPGDRFHPAGMGGRSKKLQDYFVDEKVPTRKRDAVPLLVSGSDILWVLGHRTDERFLPGPETLRVLIVRVRITE